MNKSKTFFMVLLSAVSIFCTSPVYANMSIHEKNCVLDIAESVGGKNLRKTMFRVFSKLDSIVRCVKGRPTPLNDPEFVRDMYECYCIDMKNLETFRANAKKLLNDYEEYEYLLKKFEEEIVSKYNIALKFY